MDLQTAYSYYTTLGLATSTTVKIAVAVAVGVVATFIVLEVITVYRKVRGGRSITSALVGVGTHEAMPTSPKRKGGPNFFIPETEPVISAMELETVLAGATLVVPDGEDILSDMYAEKAAVVAMLTQLREELLESNSTAAVRAIDVLTADVQRRNVNSVWQLGAKRVADSTK